VKWALLLAGGGIGTLLRFSLALFVDARLGVRFPWGTLAVNVLGCFAIGGLVTLAGTREGLSPGARLFLVSGVLGGFTTFSSFGMETWQLVEDGRVGVAALNAVGSVIACLAAVAAGVWLAREIT
jgi:CrcB protein